MHGFSAKLIRHIGSIGLRTWIDGPYGIPRNLGDFGDVLIFANGIGIAAQVPYIKELLRDVHESRVRTRRITLVWQLEKESKLVKASDVLEKRLMFSGDQEWVREWMDQLLEEDKQYYVGSSLHVLYALLIFRFCVSAYTSRVVLKITPHLTAMPTIWQTRKHTKVLRQSRFR